jgi:hypothetical protein
VTKSRYRGAFVGGVNVPRVSLLSLDEQLYVVQRGKSTVATGFGIILKVGFWLKEVGVNRGASGRVGGAERGDKVSNRVKGRMGQQL